MTKAETIRAHFGEAVKRRREVLDMTQEQLSAASGIGRQFISRVETGKASPSLPTVVALAKALEVEPAELIGDGWTNELEGKNE